MTIAQCLGYMALVHATEVASHTRKYRHFVRQSGSVPPVVVDYWIGCNGGLRKGPSPSNSRSIQDHAMAILEKTKTDN